jgi:hypothetical protein
MNRFYEVEEYNMGDVRRCLHHPHVATSSSDGMFDAPCGECEWEGYMLAEMSESQSEDAAQERSPLDQKPWPVAVTVRNLQPSDYFEETTDNEIPF